MAKQSKLQFDELNFIKQREAHIESVIGNIKAVAKYKEGDFLIAFRPETPWAKRRQVVNSYGAPKKYIVIATDKFGIPYIKEVNKNGTAYGTMLCPLKLDRDSSIVMSADHEFEVDPDYTDSIIMMDEENYDSSSVHRVKSDTFKEITAHNKQHRIRWKSNKELADYFDNFVVVGDVFHRSIMNHFTITTINSIPRDIKGRIEAGKNFCTITDTKGNTTSCSINDFVGKALYTARPRSYNELKDPK